MAGIWLPGWAWYRDNIPAAIDAYCLASASGATNICEHFWSTAGDLWCVLRNEKSDPASKWVNELRVRRGYNRAAVAVANKNARAIWALLHHGGEYRANS